jgi:hypothetical protein
MGHEVAETEHIGTGVGLRVAVGAAMVAGAVALSGCGGKEMANLQADAVIEAAGPSKEEKERFEREKRRLNALEKAETDQEIADAKAKTKKLYPPEEKDHEGGGGGGGGGSH